MPTPAVSPTSACSDPIRDTSSQLARRKHPGGGPLLTVVMLLTVALAGCSSATPDDDAPAPAPAPTQAPAEDTSAPAEAAQSTPIVLEVDGQQITGELDDTAAARSLVDQLPLTLAFQDYGDQEKLANLAQALDLDGAPEGSSAQPLTIAYYSPTEQLVLYYAPVDYNAGIVPIGTFDSSEAIETQPDGFTMTIRKQD